jgi:hypothetical protein
MGVSAQEFDSFAQGLDAKYQQQAKTETADQQGVETTTEAGNATGAAAATATDAGTTVDAGKAAEAGEGGDADKATEGQQAKKEGEADATAQAAGTGEPAKTENGDKGSRFVRVDIHARTVATERRAREAAEARVKELESKLAAAGEAGTSQQTQDSIAELSALKDSLPEEAYNALEKRMRDSDAKLDKAMKAIERFEQAEQERIETAQAEARTQIDNVIAADTVLSEWQSAVFDPETGEERADASQEAVDRWNALAQHDQALRKAPAWASKPLAERFAEAKRRTAADLGIELPAAAAPTSTTQQQTKELPAQVVKDAPGSLTNIPRGRSPEVTSAPAAEKMSLAAAIHATKGMSRAQAERMLLHGG